MSDPQLVRLERQLRNSPGDPQLLVRLGLAYERSNRLRDAFVAFDRARALAPSETLVIEHWLRLGGGKQGHYVTQLASHLSASRANAVTMLGVCGNENVASILVDTLKADPHFAVRQAAAAALGILGDERATPHLLEALDDENAWVRCRAVAALHRLHIDPNGLETISTRESWLAPMVAQWREWAEEL